MMNMPIWNIRRHQQVVENLGVLPGALKSQFQRVLEFPYKVDIMHTRYIELEGFFQER